MRYLFSVPALLSFAFAAEPSPVLELAPPTSGWRYEELRRIPAAEAGQAVVADREFIYAINNHTIAKYRKVSGERVALWEGGKGGTIIALRDGA
jgi:hypothetical protein